MHINTSEKNLLASTRQFVRECADWLRCELHNTSAICVRYQVLFAAYYKAALIVFYFTPFLFIFINPLKPKLVFMIFKHSVRTAKETQPITITNIN
jgi:hypothetical protein